LEPEDWADISTYGLYALENATVAAAERLGLPWERNHWAKASLAERLAEEHHVPAVGQLMRDLNSARKSEAYGEPTVPIDWSAEDVAIRIEEYLTSVRQLVEGTQ
jgi:hypothetical protein